MDNHPPPTAYPFPKGWQAKPDSQLKNPRTKQFFSEISPLQVKVELDLMQTFES